MSLTAERDPFDPGAVGAETRDFNARLEDLLASMPPVYTVPVEETRRARAEGRGVLGSVVRLDSARAMTIPGRAGPVALRVFRPERARAVYLHIHGGGWALGSADMMDPALDAIANGANVAVASVEYRLAPEHPYPAGPDDCEDVALWLARNARAEFGSDRLLIGGESAGAHLSVVALLRLRDRHGFSGFAGAALTYGAYDLTMTPSQARWGARNLVLNTPALAWFYDMFLPAGVDRRDPDVSPLYADLRGLPPALFTVGTLDPLLDDTLFMHARWRAAGNEAHLAVYPGGPHGFNLFPTPLGRRADERIAAYLRGAAGQEGGPS